MICVCAPSRFVGFIRLISPHIPSFAVAAGEQFDSGCAAARFDNGDDFIRLSAVFPLLCADQIDLRTRRSQCAIGGRFLFNPKEQQLGYVAEIEADPSAVWLTVLSDLLPDDISLVLKAPCVHNGQTIR